MSGWPTIRLFTAPAPAGAKHLSFSPPCAKLELFLRATGQAYEVHPAGNPGRGPKKKIPWIEIEGLRMGDSELIIDYLVRERNLGIDEGMSPEDRGAAVAFRRLFDEHFYWCGLYERWARPEVWPITRSLIFGDLPPLLRSLVPRLVRKSVLRDLHGQGLGRHHDEEIFGFARADLEAFSCFLGDKPFATGEAIRTVDCSAYGILANLYYTEFNPHLTTIAAAFPHLKAYADRIYEGFVADFPPST
jgi:glutathione S-transferase